MKLLGQYRAGNSLMHRAPVWTKYLLMALIGIVPFFVGNMWLSALALTVAVALLLYGARIPARVALSLPWMLIAMMAALIVYHGFVSSPVHGVLYAVNVTTIMYLARIVTWTTTSNALMDTIARAASPLKIFGADPEKISLAFAIMWRSIPYIFDLFGAVRDSARARGTRGLSPRFLMPAVVQAVGFGLATSDALRARGLE